MLSSYLNYNCIRFLYVYNFIGYIDIEYFSVGLL